MEADLIEPRDKKLRVLQLADVFEYANKRFLKRVLRQVLVSQIPVCVCVLPLIGRRIKLSECVAASLLGFYHEIIQICKIQIFQMLLPRLY